MEEFMVDNQINIKSFYSFFTRKYEKNFHFDGEIHDFWECLYVLSGKVRVSGNERVYELSTGDIIFHKPLELHKFAVTDENEAELLIFSFRMSGNLCGLFKDKVFSLKRSQQNIISDMLEYVSGKNEESDEEDPYMYLHPSKNHKEYMQIVSIYVIRLLLSLSDSGSVTESLATPESILYKKAMEYMEANTDKNLTVPDIARFCAVSESGLKRIFVKYAGLSVHKCFLNLKIKKSLLLLQEGKTVSEVAEILNFGSQSYFSVAFKRETGKTPSKIKQNQMLSYNPIS